MTEWRVQVAGRPVSRMRIEQPTAKEAVEYYVTLRAENHPAQPPRQRVEAVRRGERRVFEVEAVLSARFVRYIAAEVAP